MDVRDYFAISLDGMPGRFDLVIHCAANVGGRQKIDHSPLWVADNLGIDSAFFQWALDAKPDHIVYFSSSAVYPIDLQTEDAWEPLYEWQVERSNGDFGLPDATYGWSKLTGEYLAEIARANGLNVHVVRPFSGYGEDQSADYPFGAFRDRVIRREDPFEIWGDGTQIRHWIHIDDIVAAVMRMVELDDYGPVNLAQGAPVTFNEFAELWFDVAGWRPSVFRHVLVAPTGVHGRAARTARLRAFYTPQITLREGIERALALVPAPQ